MSWGVLAVGTPRLLVEILSGGGGVGFEMFSGSLSLMPWVDLCRAAVGTYEAPQLEWGHPSKNPPRATMTSPTDIF